MDTKNLFQTIEEEFAEHLKERGDKEFALSSESSQELSALARSLEQKRQQGSMTEQEQSQLKQIDHWMEKIATFNESTVKKSGEADLSKVEESIYDLTEQASPKQLRENQPVEDYKGPNISSNEADRIISGLNEQFEEKVMSKIKDQESRYIHPEEAGEKPQDTDEKKEDEEPTGTSLNDYLASVREEVPEVPFSDGDSSMDLSKLVNEDK